MIKETLKEKLSRAPIAPDYEFHEAVENALSRLPSKKTRSFYRRTGTLAATICAVMVLGAIPFAYRALSPVRPATPNTFAQPDPTTSVGPSVVIPAGSTARLVGQSDTPIDLSDPVAVAMSASHMQAGDSLRSVTLVAPTRASDFKKESVFFTHKFPGMRIGGFETSVDDQMNLSLMGVMWDEDQDSLLIGSVLYGDDLFRDLVRDRQMLDGLQLKDVYINGESLDLENLLNSMRTNSSYISGDILGGSVLETGSSTGYIHSISINPAMVKDEFVLIQIEFKHEALGYQYTFEIKANLVSKEIVLSSAPHWDTPEEPWPETTAITTELPDAAFPMPEANIDDENVVPMPQIELDPEAAVPMPTAPINQPRYTPVPTPISSEATVMITEAPWPSEYPDDDAVPTPVPTPTTEALPPEDPGE